MGLVGRKCQGHSCPAAQLSAAARVEISVGWGRAEWLSGLPLVLMIHMKDRGSLVHSFRAERQIPNLAHRKQRLIEADCK